MMKRSVFVIGDSISIHYGPFLRDCLGNEFHYDRKRGVDQALTDLDSPVGANGGDSFRVLSYLQQENEKGTQYDILLLNCGLHDIRNVLKDGKIQVDAASYKENLHKILELAFSMSLKVIWIESTPVYDEVHNSKNDKMHRFSKELEQYNRIAAGVMDENDVPIIGLHDFTDRYCPDAYYDHIHFKEEIRAYQGAFICIELKKLLGMLPTRQELIKADYPFGKAADKIPMGDPSVEWKRTGADIVLYKPQSDSYDNDNEHFLVFEVPGSDRLYAVWTQSSCEGHGDNHLVFAKSDDGINWSDPAYITGFKPGVTDRQASWGFPVVSKTGRIYIMYTRQVELYDNVSMSSGPMGCVYSDDLGETWSDPVNIEMPRSRYDNPDERYPKNWIVWQIPIRDSKGRYLAGYTLVTSKALKEQHPMWVHADTRCYFMHFENIDDNPEPNDIIARWFPEDDNGLSVPNKIFPDMSTAQEPSTVLLPDGRLFTTMRTMTGYMYYSVSDDGGETWRKPEMLRYKDGGEGIKHPLSPCPVYEMSDGKYFILHHKNDGEHLGFSQFKAEWELNEANFFRNPTFISVGEYIEGAKQPVWFSESKLLFDTDDIAVGPKQTAEVATYTSYIEWKGTRILWYPDRKFYLLGKYLTDDLLNMEK